MADYSAFTWVEKTTQVGPTRMNAIEAAVQDAAKDSKQRGAISSRPAASSATKNWIWVDSASNATSYCDGSNWYQIGSPATWLGVVAAATANVSTSAAPSTIDSVTLAAGDRVLLAGQSTASQNGIYVFSAAGSALARADDAAIARDFVVNKTVAVGSGTVWAGSTFTYTAASTPTIGTTALTFIGPGWAPQFSMLTSHRSTFYSNQVQAYYGIGPLNNIVVSPVGGDIAFWVDPADFNPPPGRTLRFRVRFSVLPNAVTSGVMVAGLHAPTVTYAAGTSGDSLALNSGNLVSGSGTSAVHPTGSTPTSVMSADFAIASAGFYVLVVQVTTASTGAGYYHLDLLAHYV